MAVTVFACNDAKGDREAGPFAGRIINIARHGACLLMSLGVLDAYNVYRLTYNKKFMHLEIQGCTPHFQNHFLLSGRPIWMDPLALEDIRAFKMGVEFLSRTDNELSEEIIDNIIAEPADDILESLNKK